MIKNRQYAGLDLFKIVAAILIITIHTNPLSSINPTADYLLTHIIARIAVPYFITVSGFFLFSRFTGNNAKDRAILVSFLRKIGILYLIATILYLPLNIYKGYFTKDFHIGGLIKDLLFSGTYFHLWYLPAVVLGVVITYLLFRKLSSRILFIVAFALYFVGMFGDSYFGLIQYSGALGHFYSFLHTIFNSTANGIFFVPIFLVLGMQIAQKPQKKFTSDFYAIAFAASMVLLLIEGMLLRNANAPTNNTNMYLTLIPCIYFLFQLLLYIKKLQTKNFRMISTWVYILHPFSISLIHGITLLTGIYALSENSLLFFILVTALSFTIPLIVIIMEKYFPGKPNQTNRAWVEISQKNLLHNLAEIKKALPEKCEIMAVVKANAYGHGAFFITKSLAHAGINRFAVSDIYEGIALRQKGINCNILVLGYTSETEFEKLSIYHLEQTVIHYEYAKQLNQFCKTIKVQVKIDTGMGGLGEAAKNINQIAMIYRMENLEVCGTFTDLSVSRNVENPSDIQFTKKQIQTFYDIIVLLKANNINPGKLHIQDSSGVLNYPEITGDIARVGILLYGTTGYYHSKAEEKISLKPVLSLKSRVVMVKEVLSGESIGNGRQFIANRDSKIALVSIGFGDGIPRNFSENGGEVLIKGQIAKVVGAISMDMLAIDITELGPVQQTDIVTLIGTDGNTTLSADLFAARCGMITAELFTHISTRVQRKQIP